MMVILATNWDIKREMERKTPTDMYLLSTQVAGHPRDISLSVLFFRMCFMLCPLELDKGA